MSFSTRNWLVWCCGCCVCSFFLSPTALLATSYWAHLEVVNAWMYLFRLCLGLKNHACLAGGVFTFSLTSCQVTCFENRAKGGDWRTCISSIMGKHQLQKCSIASVLTVNMLGAIHTDFWILHPASTLFGATFHSVSKHCQLHPLLRTASAALEQRRLFVVVHHALCYVKYLLHMETLLQNQHTAFT